MPIRLVFDDAAALNRALRQIGQGVRGDILQGLGNRLTRLAVRHVRQLTPAQQRTFREEPTRRMPAGTNIRSGWHSVVIQAVANNRYEALVRNSRFDDTPMGPVILWSLEGGAKGHRMPGRPPGLPYSWVDPRRRNRFQGRRQVGSLLLERFTRQGGSGRRVFTEGPINHPGHKPFRMVAKTRQHLQTISPLVAAVALQELAQRWANPFATITTSASVT